MHGAAFIRQADGAWIAEPASGFSERVPAMDGQRWWGSVPDHIATTVTAERQHLPLDVLVEVPDSVARGGFIEDGPVGPVLAIRGRSAEAELEGLPEEPSQAYIDRIASRSDAVPRTWPVYESGIGMDRVAGWRAVHWTLVPVPPDEVAAWRQDIDPRALQIRSWLTPVA